MSYFDDQYEAWMILGCPGDPTDIDADDMIEAFVGDGLTEEEVTDYE